ncbi:MAG: hypothetical protein ACREKE_00170, partial [bacterium]
MKIEDMTDEQFGGYTQKKISVPLSLDKKHLAVLAVFFRIIANGPLIDENSRPVFGEEIKTFSAALIKSASRRRAEASSEIKILKNRKVGILWNAWLLVDRLRIALHSKAYKKFLNSDDSGEGDWWSDAEQQAIDHLFERLPPALLSTMKGADRRLATQEKRDRFQTYTQKFKGTLNEKK